MRNDTGKGFEFGMIALLGFAVLVILIITFYPAQAQAEHANTVFEVGCLEPLSLNHYHLHIKMVSDGVETFTFAMGKVVGSNPDTLPYSGHATTNIPRTFKTSAGENTSYYLDAQSGDSPYTFYLNFTDDIGAAILPMNTWDNVSDCPPVPKPTPAPPVVDSCPAWSLESATGNKICLWDLPRATS